MGKSYEGNIISVEDFLTLNRLIEKLLDCAWEMQAHIQKEEMDEDGYDWGDEMSQISNQIKKFSKNIIGD